MLKENFKYLNKWRYILCSWVGRVTIIKMSILSKFINRFNANPINIPAYILVEIDKLILKFVWKCKEPGIAKTTLKKKHEVGGSTLPDFKSYYKVAVINFVWY